ncbi:MAG: prepilin peptidase [bacterium]
MTRFGERITRAKLRGFLFGYSQCPACHHRLMPRDLVPVVSYLV